MAVTTENSTQFGNSEASPAVYTPVSDWGGVKRVAYFSFVQGAAAGDANSLANLVKLPAGRLRIFPLESRLRRTAFGAGRTLDIGYLANAEPDGTAIAASVDKLLDGLDVSGAGAAYMGTGTNALASFVLNASQAVTIQAKVLGDTIPAEAELEGWIVYVQD